MTSLHFFESRQNNDRPTDPSYFLFHSLLFWFRKWTFSSSFLPFVRTLTVYEISIFLFPDPVLSFFHWLEMSLVTLIAYTQPSFQCHFRSYLRCTFLSQAEFTIIVINGFPRHIAAHCLPTCRMQEQSRNGKKLSRRRNQSKWKCMRESSKEHVTSIWWE
jgi:hypothetical protein